MRTNNNFNPNLDYSNIEPSVNIEDDLLFLFDFEEIELEYKKDKIDYKEMQDSSSIDVKVYNELFLDKEIDFLEVLELDLSYPLFI